MLEFAMSGEPGGFADTLQEHDCLESRFTLSRNRSMWRAVISATANSSLACPWSAT